MLIAEYDYDTDIAVQREEAGKIAFAKGISQGLSQGSHQATLETARLMRQRAYPVAEICLISGLTQAEVESLNYLLRGGQTLFSDKGFFPPLQPFLSSK